MRLSACEVGRKESDEERGEGLLVEFPHVSSCRFYHCTSRRRGDVVEVVGWGHEVVVA